MSDNEAEQNGYPPMAPSVTERYSVAGVSLTTPKALKFKNQDIVNDKDSDPHRIFRITVAVLSTNRAAMAEYVVVMRPKDSGTTPYRYVTRVYSVLNQVDEVDVNLPVVFFDSSDRKLKVKLYQYNVAQTVGVEITRWWTSDATLEPPPAEQNDLGTSGRSA